MPVNYSLFRYTVRPCEDRWLVIYRANRAIESQHETHVGALLHARQLNAITKETPNAVQTKIAGRNRLTAGWHKLRVERAMSIRREGRFRNLFVVEGRVLLSTVPTLVDTDFAHVMTAVTESEAAQLEQAARNASITTAHEHFLIRLDWLGTPLPDFKLDVKSPPIILAETVDVPLKRSGTLQRTSFATFKE